MTLPWHPGDTKRRSAESMPPAVRAFVDERNGVGVCFWCLLWGLEQPEGPVSLEHLRPISKGGDNRPSNLAWACLPHNQSRGNRARPYRTIPSRRGPQ